MSPRKLFLCGVLLFTLQFSSSSAKKKICNFLSDRQFDADCSDLILEGSIGLRAKAISLFTFRFKNLTRLSLRHNELKFVSQLHPSATGTLRHLLVSANKIENPPWNYFSNFHSLTLLDFSSNRLTEIPYFPQQIKAILEFLDLSNNRISSSLQNYFDDFRSLKALSLSSNQISEMPPLPSVVKEILIKLFLSFNRIYDIPPNYFRDFSALSQLRIEGNKITTFSNGNSIKHLSNLGELYTDQMDCDCSTETLLVWQEIEEMQNLSTVHVYGNEPHNKEKRVNPCADKLAKTNLKSLAAEKCIKISISSSKWKQMQLQYNRLKTRMKTWSFKTSLVVFVVTLVCGMTGLAYFAKCWCFKPRMDY